MKRVVLLLGALLASALLAACGDDAPRATPAVEAPAPLSPWTFESRAHAPTGAPLRFDYDLLEGDGVRVVVERKGTATSRGVGRDSTIPSDASTTIEARCARIWPDGGRGFDVAIRHTVRSGPPGADGAEERFAGRLEVRVDGAVESTRFPDLDPETAERVARVLHGAEFSLSIPMPAAGLRVGEAIDLATVVPEEELLAAVRAAVGGPASEAEVQGEYVLTGTETIDGAAVAVFAVQILGRVRSDPDDAIGMRGQVRITGTQRRAVSTGLPVGESVLQQELQMIATQDGRTLRMDVDQRVTITATRLD